MKTQVKNYIFNKTSKSITFTDYVSIDLNGMLLITNVTDNIIIFNFADPSRGGSVSGNVLTLSYNTSSMSDTDSLQIFYDDDTKSSDVIPLKELIETLNELNSRLNVLSGMANAGQPALRVMPIASVATAISGSLTTVTNLTNFGTAHPAIEMANDINNFTAIVANINNVIGK